MFDWHWRTLNIDQDQIKTNRFHCEKFTYTIMRRTPHIRIMANCKWLNPNNSNWLLSMPCSAHQHVFVSLLFGEHSFFGTFHAQIMSACDCLWARAHTCMVNELQHQLNVFIHFHLVAYKHTDTLSVTTYVDSARLTVRPLFVWYKFIFSFFCGRLMTLLADTSRHQ